MKHQSKLYLGTVLLVGALLSQSVAAATQTQGFTHYPVFVRPGVIIEAAADRGLVVDIIVKCSTGAGLIRYSKADRVYCGPDHRCVSNIKHAVRRLCR